MTVVTGGAGGALNMSDLNIGGLLEGDIVTATETLIVIDYGGGERDEFRGDFQYDSEGNPIGGTLNGIRVIKSTGVVMDATELSISVPDFLAWLEANDTDAAMISALAGVDTIIGTAGNDTLVALGGNDVLQAGAGDDGLNGGAGADRMTGGAGNDYYVFDNRQDRAIELANGGIDTVRSTVSISLHENVENLTLSGTGSIYGGGNDLNNRLIGNVGDNALQGGAGIDRMEGGKGDDSYLVDSRQDLALELKNEGTDTVRASISWTLRTNTENLTLIGSSNTNGGGNSAANIIIGNSGMNTLYGGASGDTLKGGNGIDRFVYLAATDSTVADSDQITDLRFNEFIDLAAIDANSAVAGDQAFAIVDAFSNTAGQMMLDYNDATGLTAVLMDLNGDGAADMQILLNGFHEDHSSWVL